MIFWGTGSHGQSCKGQTWFAKQVETIMAQSNGTTWAIDVRAPLGDGSFEDYYAFNRDHPMTPASNTKLLTCGTAWINTPHEAQYLTKLSTQASSASAVQLCLQCAADPGFSEQALEALMATASGSGDKPSDVLAISPRYPGPEFADSWQVGDVVADYGAHPAQGCLVNGNLFSFSALPNPSGRGPVVLNFSSPAVAASVDVDTSLTFTQSGGPPLTAQYVMGRTGLILAGSLAPNAQAQAFNDLPVAIATEFYSRMALYHARKAGLVTGGAQLAWKPCEPKNLFYSKSAQLSALLNHTLQESDNFYAETIARLNAYQVNAPPPPMDGPAAIDLGIATISQTLGSLGISSAWQLYDGSGVSRFNLIAPQVLGDLLQYLFSRPDFAQFQPLLPTGCVSGTLSSRFCSPATAGKVHAKTGTLTHDIALSGYAYAPYSPQPFIFSVIANNSPLSGTATRVYLDAIVQAIFEIQANCSN
ncbi:MAG: D-alanyl-D-alanine carboxypeptidase/D-alanyl-D-alanine-endopeptidase [archaeon]|nr:D-alanyl-D-alanine carboxypeptidase/D-alanyl-D-alanine-endopeptidase [archaeon]